jgi:hypothetical protein
MAQEPTKDKRTTGLYGKFTIRRNDGTDAAGEKHDGCEYFVLDLTTSTPAPRCWPTQAPARWITRCWRVTFGRRRGWLATAT